MPYVLVAYDISDDSVRAKAADKLIAMGFTRLQRSLYAKKGGAGDAKEAARALARIVDFNTDNVIVMVVPWESLDRAWRLGVSSNAGSGLNYAII